MGYLLRALSPLRSGACALSHRSIPGSVGQAEVQTPEAFATTGLETLKKIMRFHLGLFAHPAPLPGSALPPTARRLAVGYARLWPNTDAADSDQVTARSSAFATRSGLDLVAIYTDRHPFRRSEFGVLLHAARIPNITAVVIPGLVAVVGVRRHLPRHAHAYRGTDVLRGRNHGRRDRTRQVPHPALQRQALRGDSPRPLLGCPAGLGRTRETPPSMQARPIAKDTGPHSAMVRPAVMI